jgi:lysophospholipase L1-like esterase
MNRFAGTLVAVALLACTPAAARARSPRVPPPPPLPAVAVQTPIEDPSGHALAAFAAGLRRAAAGKGQAHILAYGASHTAGDFYTGFLRRGLQQRFGDAGHGLVLPGKPWRHYRHSDINLASSDGWVCDRVDKADARADGLYGIAGASVRSDSPSDWVRVSTTRDNPVGRKASVVEAWYLKQPGGGAFDIRIDGRKARRVATAAESPAAGYETFALKDAGHTVEIRPVGDGEVRLFGVLMERRVPGVVLDTVGIPGSRAEYLLQWNEALFREQVARRRPDLVILSYGTNEAGDDDVPIADYETALRAAVARVRSAAPDASCLLIGPTDRPLPLAEGGWGPRPRRAEVTAVQRRVSAETGCAFFDAAGLMGGEGGMLRWVAANPPLGSSDHVHLTPDGYAVMGSALLRELLRPAAPASPRTPSTAPCRTGCR